MYGCAANCCQCGSGYGSGLTPGRKCPVIPPPDDQGNEETARQVFAGSYRRTDGDLAPGNHLNQVKLKALNKYDDAGPTKWGGPYGRSAEPTK